MILLGRSSRVYVHMMSRMQPWAEICPDRIQKRISACTSSGLKLKSENDPTKFIVGDGHDKSFRCSIGNPHRCSCTFSQPCIHILFVLVSFFKVARTNASLWQKGVSELELSEWIAGRSEIEKCVFCRDAVTEEKDCEHCGARFHNRCLQLASTAGKCRNGACPKCATELSIVRDHSPLRCKNCNCACRDDHYRCLLCDGFFLCPRCYSSSKAHSFHPFSHRKESSSALFSTTAAPGSVEELQYREINPEDYEMLVSLDSGKAKKLPPHVLSKLPLLKYDLCRSGNQCCPICQQNYCDQDVCLALPCGHTMHRECGRCWLSQYSDECPIDHLAVDRGCYTNGTTLSVVTHVKKEKARTRSSAQRLSNVNKSLFPPIGPR
ncbi:hypothetical protein ABL78_4450 [Leptomonas seymouri]|uniref:RING-type domain-containing protein n=1 Tax=Leptomonas seymouri TaxID=5684 RepID=A0A0N0P5H3_LEPSE|nr:hypothetical protein ABL78_4450 [Leptomonas seymouri]|eukprot:KPI86466.1 hypothetical protein ABL78_4450 [Leptomonas seymouri]